MRTLLSAKVAIADEIRSIVQTASKLDDELANWATTQLHRWQSRTIGKFDPLMTESREDFLWLFGRVDVYADRKYSCHFLSTHCQQFSVHLYSLEYVSQGSPYDNRPHHQLRIKAQYAKFFPFPNFHSAISSRGHCSFFLLPSLCRCTRPGAKCRSRHLILPETGKIARRTTAHACFVHSLQPLDSESAAAP